MSNLTVSYTSQTAAGPAPAAGAVSAAADAPADSPLGFFATLIDQLIANVTSGNEKPDEQPDTDAAAIGAPENYPLPLGYGAPQAPTPVEPQTGADLLADLTAQLDTLQAQLAQGTKPSADQLKQLDDTFAALSAAVALTPAATQPTGETPADDQIAALVASLGLNAKADAKPITDARERLLALAQSFAATAPALANKLETLATQLADLETSPDRLAQFTGQAAGDDADTVADIIRALLNGNASAEVKLDPRTGKPADTGNELLQILASLGLSTGPQPATASTASDASVQASATVPAPLLRLSNQLSKLSTDLAAVAPDLSAKLDAVAAKLVSVDADPKLFADLTAAASTTDGDALDQLVRNLLDPKQPPAPVPSSPQIAATAKLDIPAPLLPDPSKSAVAEVKAAQPQTAPVTADSATDPAPRIAVAPVAERTPGPDQVKAEPKAAAVVAETAKADPAATNAATTTQPAVQQPIAAATNARALPAAYQSVANPINMGQVAFEMVRQIHQGTSRFTIRLDPPELGRVDVKMQVDQQGAVTARLTVDRAETLDMFQRDQRQLERALAQAGLDSARTNLEFSLRQNNSGQSFADQRQQQPSHGGARFSLSGSDDAVAPAVTLYRGIASAGGVNIFA